MPDMVNPPHIITIDADGFSVDVNRMDVGRTYLLEFDGSLYEISRGAGDSLIMCEVLRPRDLPVLAGVAARRAVLAAADRAGACL